MTLREQFQQRENDMLSPYACRSAQSRGRQRPEEECSVRTPFQRDTDRIVYSKAFRRLKHKTQVFLQPEGDHYRTRMTHTLEVSRIARTIARALSLNEDLTEAIALGHDLGHTPFGHAGERALNTLMPGGFAHYQQSVRVVERLEKNGEGLNLTWEVRNGILCHTKGQAAATLEGQIVRLADHIAYINHDIEDALRGGIIFPMDIPLEVANVLGFTHKARIDALVRDQWDSHTGEDNNLLLMDAGAQPVSLTDQRNEGTSSVQYIMRSQEIKVQEPEEEELAAVQKDNGTIWTRIADMFRDIWNTITSWFRR